MRNYSLASVIRAGVWGTFVGGAVGVTVGLLMAPEAGIKLRRRLAYRLEHLADNLGALVENVLAPAASGEARRSGDALVADARERAQQIRDDIDALLSEIREADRDRPATP